MSNLPTPYPVTPINHLFCYLSQFSILSPEFCLITDIQKRETIKVNSIPQGFMVDFKRLQILLRHCSLCFLCITYN